MENVNQLKDNSSRGRYILIVFYIMAVMTPIVLISDYMEYSLLQTSYSTAQADSNDQRQLIAGFTYAGLNIVAIVFFIMWFRRAYFNLHALDIPLAHTEGWAAGSWFVPILNLFRPYQIMSEIWDQTQLKIGKSSPEPKTLVGTWWFFWIIGGIFERMASRMALKLDDIESYQNSTLVSMISTIFTGITLIFIILIIRKIIVWEEQLYNQDFEMSIEDHLI